MAGDPRGTAITSGQVAARAQRVFSRGNEEPPQPVYINAVEFSAMGMDVFMDVGVVTPEAINAVLQQKSAADVIPTVNFLVNFRFGMSLQATMMMHQRLTELLRQSQIQAAAAMEQAEKNKSGT